MYARDNIYLVVSKTDGHVEKSFGMRESAEHFICTHSADDYIIDEWPVEFDDSLTESYD